jgi:hypothetical protein
MEPTRPNSARTYRRRRVPPKKGRLYRNLAEPAALFGRDLAYAAADLGLGFGNPAADIINGAGQYATMTGSSLAKRYGYDLISNWMDSANDKLSQLSQDRNVAVHNARDYFRQQVPAPPGADTSAYLTNRIKLPGTSIGLGTAANALHGAAVLAWAAGPAVKAAVPRSAIGYWSRVNGLAAAADAVPDAIRFVDNNVTRLPKSVVKANAGIRKALDANPLNSSTVAKVLLPAWGLRREIKRIDPDTGNPYITDAATRTMLRTVARPRSLQNQSWLNVRPEYLVGGYMPDEYAKFLRTGLNLGFVNPSKISTDNVKYVGSKLVDRFSNNDDSESIPAWSTLTPKEQQTVAIRALPPILQYSDVGRDIYEAVNRAAQDYSETVQ